MPPLTSSRKVIPAGYSECQALLTGPNATHPPSFSFGLDTDDPAVAAAFCTDWFTDVANGFQLVLYSQYTWVDTKMRTSAGSFNLGAEGAGQAVAVDLMPPNVSALVRGLSGLGGRRGRARMYWPGVNAEADIDNAGALDPSHQTDLQRIADQFITSAIASGCAPVILHTYSWPYGTSDPGPPGGFPAPTPITSWSVQSVSATQRRRLR